MRLKIESSSRPLVITLFLVIVFLFHGKSPLAQAEGNERVKFKIFSDPEEPVEQEKPNNLEYPKHAYFARVKKVKSEHVGTAESDKSEVHNSDSSDESDYVSGSSSSSEEHQELPSVKSSSGTGTSAKSKTSQQKTRQFQMSKTREQGKPRPARKRESGNWYSAYGPQGKSQLISGEDSGSGGGGTPSNARDKDKTRPGWGKPYNVTRVRLPNAVDPEVYNFFQFRPYSRAGWLWGQRLIRRHRPRPNLRHNSTIRPPDGLDTENDTDNDTDPSNKYDWEFRRYDRACLYVEYKKQKLDAVIPIIPEELKRTVDGQNEVLANKFLDWQFLAKDKFETIALQDQAEKHPLYLSFKFLLITMELFRDKICRNASSYAVASAASAPLGAVGRALAIAKTTGSKLLPTSFVDDIFRLFLTLREITLTKNVPDYATTLDDEEVYIGVLEKCKAEEPNINWYSHSCGDQVLSNDFPNNFACTPLVDYDFNSKLYDPIVDAMWHMFNSVHAYCFKYFQINTRLWHRYSLIIANTFTYGIRQRWTASVASQNFYKRLLGPDHHVHLETMNRCLFATTLRSDVPAVLPRFDTLSPITFGKERTIHADGAAGAAETA